MSFYLDPLEQRSGGSLPSTGGGFHTSPLEQRSGGSLPPTTGGFQLDPLEQRSGGSLPSSGAYGRSAPAVPAASYAGLFDMFFGG